jgi:hypothetical protein
MPVRGVQARRADQLVYQREESPRKLDLRGANKVIEKKVKKGAVRGCYATPATTGKCPET